MFQGISAILQVVNSIIVFFLWPEALRRIARKIVWTRLPRKSHIGPTLKHLPNADELRALDSFYITGSHAYDFIHKTKDPAPQLLCLTLWAEMPGLVDKDMYPASHFIAPNNVFAGVVPKLLELRLINIALNADSPLLLANLTKLNLSRSYNTYCPRSFSLPVFVDILRRMPNMQVLSADDILTDPLDASSLETYLARVPKVSLPDLVILSIHTPFFLNYRGLLRQLELKSPSKLRLHMGTSVESFNAMDESILPSYIASADSRSPPVRALSIKSHEPQSFTLSGWRTVDDTLKPRSFEDTFSAKLQLAGLSTTEGISSLFTQLPMRTVETLSISWLCVADHNVVDHDVIDHNVIDWVTLLQSMDQLKRMTITICTKYQPILKALAKPASDESGSSSLLCPQLTALGFPWTSKYLPPLETSSLFLQTLADTLEMRLKHGSKLGELLVGKEDVPCGDDSGLKVLRERVGQLCSDSK